MSLLHTGVKQRVGYGVKAPMPIIIVNGV